MIRRKMIFATVLGFSAMVGFAGHTAIFARGDQDEETIIFAQGDDDEAHEALTKAITVAKVTLQQGLVASKHKGQSISGKFEFDEEKLLLSVYIAKDGKFFEELVDYTTGKVAKVKAITNGDDLAAANAQNAAMSKAKTSLKDAVDKVVRQAAGSRAVSVAPSLKSGHPIATVLLLIGEQFKIVDQSLE